MQIIYQQQVAKSTIFDSIHSTQIATYTFHINIERTYTHAGRKQDPTFIMHIVNRHEH